MVVEPRQERSRARREALLRAAIALRAEGGARAVTHRAVAARAGLPAASTTYYFDSIQQLTEEALALHVADRVRELDAVIAGAMAAGRSPEDVGARLAEALADRATDVVVAQYEIYLEAVRNPNMRPTVAEALDAFERFAVEVLEALGAGDPEGAAPGFIALIDGFALHRLARPRPRDEEVALLRRALRALFLAEVDDPRRMTQPLRNLGSSRR
jgi:TetR/AcrR family transcriptional regulator, regulator of biofilm formation and stress response